MKYTTVWNKIKSIKSLLLFLLIGVTPNMFAQVSTNHFKGVNWADTRDNFQSGVLYLSGLSSTDTYSSASIVAERVIGQFVSKLGSNSVRLPINEATVSDYWNTYTGVIDVALTKGTVVLCYWGNRTGANSVNMDDFWSMWKKVVDKYGSNANCYFEVFNEPSGFTKSDLLEMYATWLSRYPSVPHGRIILDGSGLAMNVPDVGSDPRFNNCLLAVHDYSFFASYTTEQQWRNHLKGFVGAYANRTVMTEFGAPMKAGPRDGINYPVQDYNSPPGSYFVAYLRGMTSQLREWNMGSFYWPGLRDNDWYSMMTKTGTGADISLSINNQSGLDRVHYAWGGIDRPQEPYLGTPQSIPGTIQLEHFDSGGNQIAYFDKTPGSEVTPLVNFRVGEDVDIQECSDTGGGYNIGFSSAGEWLEYTVNVEMEDVFDLEIRVACNGTGRSLSLSMDGNELTGTVSVPNTGGWQKWTTVSVKNISLKPGIQVLRLTIGAIDDVNLNYLSFIPSSLTGLPGNSPDGITIYPNPFFGEGIQVKNKGSFNYYIHDMLGNLFEEGKCEETCQIGTGLASGFYILSVENEQGKFFRKIERK